MPEPINFMQNKEGLLRHPIDTVNDTARNNIGSIDNTGKTIKVKTRSIFKMLNPGFFIRSSGTIQNGNFYAGKGIYSWQTMIESRFGEA